MTKVSTFNQMFPEQSVKEIEDAKCYEYEMLVNEAMEIYGCDHSDAEGIVDAILRISN